MSLWKSLPSVGWIALWALRQGLGFVLHCHLLAHSLLEERPLSSWFDSFHSQNVLWQIEQGWHTQTLHKQRTNTYTRFLRHLSVIFTLPLLNSDFCAYLKRPMSKSVHSKLGLLTARRQLGGEGEH